MNEKVLHFVEFEFQFIALGFFIVLYALKARHIMKLSPPREAAPSKGSAAMGVAWSFASLFTPLSMESTARHPWHWIEFAVYHLAAAAAIGSTFTFPFFPGIMTPAVRAAAAVLVLMGAVVGLFKIRRRYADPHLRRISVPDDYASLLIVEVFYLAAAGCLIYYTDSWRFVFFLLTGLFLFYVPFSKISHYLYWFFARVYLGLRYGRRGVLPAAGRRNG